jgi:hypothetical protein
VLGATLGIPQVFLLSGILCLGMSLFTWAVLPNDSPRAESSPGPAGDARGHPEAAA